MAWIGDFSSQCQVAPFSFVPPMLQCWSAGEPTSHPDKALSMFCPKNLCFGLIGLSHGLAGPSHDAVAQP